MNGFLSKEVLAGSLWPAHWEMEAAFVTRYSLATKGTVRHLYLVLGTLK